MISSLKRVSPHRDCTGHLGAMNRPEFLAAEENFSPSSRQSHSSFLGVARSAQPWRQGPDRQPLSRTYEWFGHLLSWL